MASVNELIQQARLIAAVNAYERGDKEAAYRALGLTAPSVPPSDNDPYKGAQAYGKQLTNAYNLGKYPLDLGHQQIDNTRKVEDYVRSSAKAYVTPPTQQVPVDEEERKQLEAVSTAKADKLANTALALLRSSGQPVNEYSVHRMLNALTAADGVNMGVTGAAGRAAVGDVLANHAASIGIGGISPNDMANYYKIADDGINALSSPSKDNPLAQALSVLGTNALKAKGMGGVLNGTFAFLGDRNGALDSTVMDALHAFARQNGGNTYERDLAMFYSKLPEILTQIAKDNNFSDVKQMVDYIQDQKEPDMIWSDVMKQAYVAYRPLYTK